MKLVIEHEVTFKNISDIEVKVTQKKSSRAFVKVLMCQTMKQDMLNSPFDLRSQELRGSLPSY